MNPPRPPSVPMWNFSLVLETLKAFPFEPLDSVESSGIKVPVTQNRFSDSLTRAVRQRCVS